MGMLVELLIFFCESNENVAVCHHLTIRRLLIVNLDDGQDLCKLLPFKLSHKRGGN